MMEAASRVGCVSSGMMAVANPALLSHDATKANLRGCGSDGPRHRPQHLSLYLARRLLSTDCRTGLDNGFGRAASTACYRDCRRL